MENFTGEQYAQMVNALRDNYITSANKLQRWESACVIIHETILQINGIIGDYKFSDRLEEIRFFKETRPKFLKEMIYYSELYRLELYKPVGDHVTHEKYYQKHVERISSFFDRNQFFYAYYRAGKTNSDEALFLRESNSSIPIPDHPSDFDPRFSTVGSSKIAKIMAYESLNTYLLKENKNLYNTSAGDQDMNDYKPKTIWTDSKVALIELAYAIHSRGAVDSGKADVKEVVTALEYVFNICVGNYYAVFQQNIRIRKKNRTVYLDQLKEHLERRMDDADINPR